MTKGNKNIRHFINLQWYIMDLDELSNCSSLSLHSEEIRSNASTLSGLSIYQDEFAELRHVVNPSKYPTSYVTNKYSTPKQCFGVQYEVNNRISDVSSNLNVEEYQIQEKHKLYLHSLEKNLELKYYDKIEKLLKTNQRLQSELKSCNEQIERLLESHSFREHSSLLDKNFIQLEKKHHNLTLLYSELQNKYFQSRKVEEEYEIENRELLTQLSELNIELDTKNECIREFKDKIAQQYVEIEMSIKTNFKLSQDLNETILKLEHVKKSETWYKDRLSICQNEKQVLTNKILEYKSKLYSQQGNIDILNVECSKWKAKCEMKELEALKGKDKLSKQLEPISLVNISSDTESAINKIKAKENVTVINYYETIIQDLTQEISKIKEHVEAQDNMIENVTKENSKLIGQCIMLQKTIQHNEVVIEELESVEKYLNADLNEMKEKVNQKSKELTARENQVLTLQAELKLQQDEQQLIEQSVKTIREQFKIFKRKHEETREELLTKNKQILQIENEKQKLFMDNNWNICELEKIREKDVVINQLKDELIKRNETLNTYISTAKTLETEMSKTEEKTSSLLDEKQSTIDKFYLEIQRYEAALAQYKIMVNNLEKQINDLQTLLNVQNLKELDLKDNIKILKEEVNQRDIKLKEMIDKCTILENKSKYNENVRKAEKCENNNKKEAHDYTLQNLLNRNDVACNTIPLAENHEMEMSISSCNKTDNCKILGKKSINYRKQLTSQLTLRINELEIRIKKLDAICNKCYATLNNIFSIVEGNEQGLVEKLNVLLQVKELELKEKQKKYEVNNRTLLRKVKEHMKGRNAAEKHNKYLQEIFNAVSDENNSLKLEIKSKELEIENMKHILDKFTNINEKLKLSIFNLEESADRHRTCDTCTSSTEKIKVLEKHINELESDKISWQNLLMEKEDVIVNLQEEVGHLLQKNVNINGSNKKLKEDINKLTHNREVLTETLKTLEDDIKKKHSNLEELTTTLKQQQKQYSEISDENNQLKAELDQLNIQVGYLSEEVKILGSRLQVKSEELSQLEDRKSKIENNCLEKEDFQNIIRTLKHYLRDMQLESASINNEKNFLQRLCNDLKLALKSHASHNKVLQQKLDIISKERDFHSLPNVLPTIPCDIKFDEEYINQLLQQAQVEDTPMTDMKNCLVLLKKEISTLQDKIARKNIQY